MGILDKLKSTAQQAVNSAAQSAGNRRETGGKHLPFPHYPRAWPKCRRFPRQAWTAPLKRRLTVLALCAYAAARKEENGRLYFDGLTLLCQKRRDNIAIEEWRRI